MRNPEFLIDFFMNDSYIMRMMPFFHTNDIQKIYKTFILRDVTNTFLKSYNDKTLQKIFERKMIISNVKVYYYSNLEKYFEDQLL